MSLTTAWQTRSSSLNKSSRARSRSMRLSEYDLIRACSTPLAAGLRPEPEVLVSDWATEHRVLVQVSSAEPGGWRNERTPYLVEPMNCLSAHSGIEQVAVMKGAQ